MIVATELAREVEFYLDVVEELLARGEKEKKNCAVSYCVVKLGIVARRTEGYYSHTREGRHRSCKERKNGKKTRTAFIYGAMCRN